MSKHCIILGHGDGDNGATGVNNTERGYLLLLGKHLRDIIKDNNLHITLIDNRNVYGKREFGKNSEWYTKFETVTELHFNAFNKTARGSEVLFGAGLKPDTLDNRFKEYLSRFWKWRRFLDTDNIYNCRMAKKHKINYRLVEICFCDNQEDMSIFNRDVLSHAVNIIKCIINTEIQTKDKIYRVQVGAFSNKSNADKLLQEVKKHYPDSYIKEE